MVQREKQGRIRIRLSRPYMRKRKRLFRMFNQIFDSGFLTQGEYVVEFERYISSYLGIKHAVAVSSGTAALHLALIALGIGKGDEVIVPAYTFPATANVVELVGAKPVFVDIDLHTYNIDTKKIKLAVSGRTKAIIPVHLFGNPADMEVIMNIAKVKGLRVIEDSAGALGSVYKGKKCGSIGDIGCFSFHPRKIITTGEGGMVVTNNKEISCQIQILRNHGMKRMNNKDDFIAAGFNYRMNELEAQLGIIQMREIETIIKKRQKIALLYKRYFDNDNNLALQKTIPNCINTFQALVVRFKRIHNVNIIDFLKKKNVETAIGTYALHILRFYKSKYGYIPNDYPNAYELYLKGLALPFYYGIQEHQIKQVCRYIKEFILKNC